MNKIKLAIVDNHALFREGVGSLLAENGEIEISFEAENGKVLIDKLAKIPTDIILLDLEMPVMTGYEALEIIKVNYPKMKIIALTFREDDASIANVVRMGANGYMLKDDSIDELRRAIFTVYENDFYFTPRVVNVMNSIAERARVKQKKSEINFTVRERAILKLICSEYTTREIAVKLNTGTRTVEWHKQNMIEKTNSKTTAGIVFYAVKHGLVT